LEMLYIPPMVWSEEEYSDDAILLVLASTDYNRTDYIENIEEFVK
jgi:hypothetical protein